MKHLSLNHAFSRNLLLLSMFLFSIPVGMNAQQTSAVQQNDTTANVVEIPPKFPGGDKGLMEFLNNNIKYPPAIAHKRIEGRVIVKFIVTEKGTIKDIEVEKSVDPLLDKEVIRVVRKMPRWRPGKRNGKKVDVLFHLPVTFRL